MKVEKRELPFYLNSTLTNNVNNTMPSLEKIMGRDYKKYKDSKDNSDSTQQEENGMNSRGIKKNSNHLKKSHKKVTKKGKKSKGKIKEMSKNLKKIPKKISLNKGKDKMNIVRALAKSKAKKLTRKIFRNNNYMEIYNNRKDIQMDLKSKPLNQIVEEAGII
jgi:ATPase subunit of ABC transporter with duplicated ATPase domains